MPKATQTKPRGSRGPEWKTTWPRNGNLAAWFRCMLHKCAAIADDDTAGEQAQLPIEALAGMGHPAEALRWVDRFLRRIPRQRVLTTVRMAEVGAQISLEIQNLPRMEKYLAIAESTEPFNTRKCDKGFSINSVREFRADNGILDPQEAVDDEQRVTAKFRRAERQFRTELAAGNREDAQRAIAEMEEAARESDDRYEQQRLLSRVVTAYARLKDVAAVKRCVRKLSKEEREEILDADTLLDLGLKRDAVARSQRDIARRLGELRTMTDPNIHFPAMAISRSLQFLVAQGKQSAARRWLRRALREMPTWPVIEYGWMTSAVYHALAEATAVVEGPEAAAQLLDQAIADGRIEKRPGFRAGAVNAALDLKADIGRLDEAIADARKIRSPRERRLELGKLLARAGRWKELRAVLCEVQSPEEAADVAWWIKFELPGGEVR